jgi:hypothetical protein
MTQKNRKKIASEAIAVSSPTATKSAQSSPIYQHKAVQKQPKSTTKTPKLSTQSSPNGCSK